MGKENLWMIVTFDDITVLHVLHNRAKKLLLKFISPDHSFLDYGERGEL